MSLVVSVLGPFQATYDGQPLVFATDATRALLAYLAIEGGQSHSRAQFAALLWPDQPQVAAFANLRQTLARLRKALPAAAATLLHVTSQTLQLQRDGVTLDQTRFEELLAQSATHTHTNLVGCAACAERLREAVALYRGDLLQGLELKDSQPFEEWLLVRREMLHRQALDALYALTRQAENVADYGQMRQYAVRQVALEPWREEAHRQLMLALASSGQRTAALAQYETCRRILAQEFGIEPEVETQLLYERIRGSTLAPATLRAHLPAQNLPTQLTPFVGREHELAEIAARLQQPDVRLLTLVGTGGMGKTRLALETARALLDTFPDGVFFVALAPITSASAIAAAIVAAMNLSLGGDPEQALPNALRDKQVLLILDNFEHLIEGVGLVAQLLQIAPRLQVLATSREQLNLRVEHLYQVQPMEDAAGATLSDVANSSALRLFTQSAQRVQSSFQLSEANLAAVLRICQLVQGMPLGLELAAAWVGSISLDAIADEIEHSADFLASEWHDAPERQRSMRAVFDWSWKLLDAAEQEMFRQLAVFRGGFTRETAQAVVGASLRVLTRLMHKSLVRRGAAGRYEIHELLRQYAAEQLAAAPDEQAAMEARHSTYYLTFLAQHEMRLARNQPREAAAEIQGEIDNIRQAWTCATRDGRSLELDRAAYSAWQFYTLRGLVSEAASAFASAADRLRRRLPDPAADSEQSRERQGIASKMLAFHVHFLIAQSKHDQALPLAQQAIELARASQNVEGEVLGYLGWAQAAVRKGQYSEGHKLLEHALRLARDYQGGAAPIELLLDCEWISAAWLQGVCHALGDVTAARAFVNQGVRRCQELGKLRGEMTCLANRADSALTARELPSARSDYQRALAIAHQIGSHWEGIVQLGLGDTARLEGEYTQALALTERAIGVFRDTGDALSQGVALPWLVRLYCYLGDSVRAQRVLDQLSQLSQRVELPLEFKLEELFARTLYAHQINDHTSALAYADRAQAMVRVGSQVYLEQALLLNASAHARLGHFQKAQGIYEQVLTVSEQLEHPSMAAEARAGLAQSALVQGDRQRAAAHVQVILELLTQHTSIGLYEPFDVYLACYRVLAALDDARAVDVLRIGAQRLRDYAGNIADAALRQSFLENVATHRELLRIDATDGALAAASS